MKTLRDILPCVSQDCVDLNPAYGGVVTLKPNQNATTGILSAKKAKHETNHQCKIQDSEPQPHKTPALGTTVQGKTQGLERTRVCFIGYRVKPLDPDNFAGSVKDLLDGLRHSGLIHGDEVWRIAFETRQEKVKSYAEEKTVIELEF